MREQGVHDTTHLGIVSKWLTLQQVVTMIGENIVYKMGEMNNSEVASFKESIQPYIETLIEEKETKIVLDTSYQPSKKYLESEIAGILAHR